METAYVKVCLYWAETNVKVISAVLSYVSLELNMKLKECSHILKFSLIFLT